MGEKQGSALVLHTYTHRVKGHIAWIKSLVSLCHDKISSLFQN